LATLALVRAVIIVMSEPHVKILLELLDRPIDLLPERDSVELVEDRLVERLTDPV
jgi:hypothetical protein